MISETFDVSPITSLWEIMTLGAWPIWTPEAWLAGFMLETTKHFHILNLLALSLMVTEKIFEGSSH